MDKNEAKIRAFMADLYRFLMKYYEVPKDKYTDDNFWDELIRETNSATAKHAWRNDMLPAVMFTAIVQHAEDQVNRREILCGSNNAPVAAMMRYLANEEAIRCHDTNGPDSTCG